MEFGNERPLGAGKILAELRESQRLQCKGVNKTLGFPFASLASFARNLSRLVFETNDPARHAAGGGASLKGIRKFT
jgi:hypothetical protein